MPYTRPYAVSECERNILRTNEFKHFVLAFRNKCNFEMYITAVIRVTIVTCVCFLCVLLIIHCVPGNASYQLNS